MSQTFWLRGEDKKYEFRRALSPRDCKKLIDAGHKVVVEDWKDSIIPTRSYQAVGCEITAKNSWKTAPKEVLVVGLKYLPNDLAAYEHRHIYFAHAFKGQDDAFDILNKFQRGGGKIIDLEFMVDEKGRRVCAFGHWAGYVGAALGLVRLRARDKRATFNLLNQKQFFRDQKELLSFIESQCQNLEKTKAIIIGALGRSGQGAAQLLSHFHINTTLWDLAQTRKGGPFHEILEHELFINCVLSMSKIPPFLTREMLGGHLQVISDVSCDPDSDCNVLPLYDVATKLSQPTHSITEKIELLAIDNLPSVLPKESTEDFSSQLVEYLLDYDEMSAGPIRNSLMSFQGVMERTF